MRIGKKNNIADTCIWYKGELLGQDCFNTGYFTAAWRMV